MSSMLQYHMYLGKMLQHTQWSWINGCRCEGSSAHTRHSTLKVLQYKPYSSTVYTDTLSLLR